MFIQQQYRKPVLAGLLFLFLTFLLVSLYIKHAQSEFVTLTQLKLSEQELLLTSLADALRSEGVYAQVDDIIKDCSTENRAKFDTQLGKLNELRNSELIEMDKLFNACGDYYAVRKAVMVQALKREFEVYQTLIAILKASDSRLESTTDKSTQWESVVTTETKKSELTTKLSLIQKDIITALLSGVSIQSDQMQKMVVEGQRTREELISLIGGLQVVEGAQVPSI